MQPAGRESCYNPALAGIQRDQAKAWIDSNQSDQPRDHGQIQVVGVSDGDTITVLHSGKGERIRLHGIDCPEKRQAFGNRAKQFTSNLVFAKTVTVQALNRDRYGRTVDQSLSDLEEEARVARRGLWADRNPIPPWQWRIARKNPRLYRQPRGPTAESTGTFDPTQYIGQGNRYNCPDFRSQADRRQSYGLTHATRTGWIEIGTGLRANGIQPLTIVHLCLDSERDTGPLP